MGGVCLWVYPMDLLFCCFGKGELAGGCQGRGGALVGVPDGFHVGRDCSSAVGRARGKSKQGGGGWRPCDAGVFTLCGFSQQLMDRIFAGPWLFVGLPGESG